MTIELLTEEQTDRLRWSQLGLGECDLSDIPVDVQLAYRERMHTRISTAPAVAAVPVTPRRFRRMHRVLVGSVVVLAFAFASIWSFQSAVASQRRAIQKSYAKQLIAFVLDLYEEDLEVLTGRVVEAEVMLPDRSPWVNNSLDEQMMYACGEALNGLQSSRLGFADAAVEQIANAETLLYSTEHASGETSELSFVFNLIAGKAGIEVTDSKGNRRPGLSNEGRDLRRRSLDAICLADEYLSNQLVGELDPNERALLQCAMKTDLARGEMRSIRDGNTLTQQFELVRQLLEDAQNSLDQVNEKSERWRLHQARLLNNRVLFLDRQISNETEKRQSILDELALLERALGSLLRPEDTEELDLSNSTLFECGVCYSNFADVLGDFANWNIEQFSEGDYELLARSIANRRLAAKFLGEIDRKSRTERHFENLMISYSRALADQLKVIAGREIQQGNAVEEFVVSEEFRGLALPVHLELGNVLTADVAQVTTLGRLCVAMCLPDEYDVEEVIAYAESTPMPQNSCETFVKWIASRARLAK